MLFVKLLFILFIGKCFENVIFAAYNPLLTYTIRFHKVSFQPNFTGNYTIDKYREKEFINGFLSLDSPQTIDKIVVVFQRCNPEGVNCEYFQSWSMTDLCPKLRDKNQIWSSWYGAFDPTPICPVKKVDSFIRNGTIDFAQAVRWYPDVVNYQWKVTQKFYAGERYIGTYTFEVSVFGYRKRNKKPSKQ
ncbi:uncharacterized protein LOC132942095 [Metopolophium dirhodum]|uniref:uncharacterized protein LOC132942095 n=1 Tax=Metopolophium dirhodum TaxID=44670 RepID=UPI00298F4DEB|nr:uncharacterized protein LOC132942095 [Metopolophium dirhodum]